MKRDTEKIIKILGLNIGIGVIDTIFFSPGLLGVEIIGASAIEITRDLCSKKYISLPIWEGRN